MPPLAIALISISLSVAAQFLLKAGMSGATIQAALAQPLTLRSVALIVADKSVLAGFVLYALGAVLWLGVLARWDVSKAYPLVGLGFVATLAVGAILGETVTALRMAGVMLIVVGVWIVSRT